MSSMSDELLTQKFWDSTLLNELVRPVCNECSTNFFTPSQACPCCLSPNWEYQRSSGLGTVYSYTTVHRGPDLSWEVPFVLGIIDLDEGWTMLSRLLVPISEELLAENLIGMKVKVEFKIEETPQRRNLPVFRPVKELL